MIAFQVQDQGKDVCPHVFIHYGTGSSSQYSKVKQKGTQVGKEEINQL